MASVCNAGVGCIASLAGQEVAMNQLPYSLIWRVAEKQIIPASEKAGPHDVGGKRGAFVAVNCGTLSDSLL